MVWQSETALILMLAKLVEKGCAKADRYWPKKEGLRLPTANVSVRRVMCCVFCFVRRSAALCCGVRIWGRAWIGGTGRGFCVAQRPRR